jgi:hypothetical protein
MLGEVEDAGAGTQVYFGALLTGVHAAPEVGPRVTMLRFATGDNVTASKVLLNLPGNAVEGLDPSSVLFSDATPAAKKWLGKVSAFGMSKVYAWYDDAWWSTKLGLMEGYFSTGNDTRITPDTPIGHLTGPPPSEAGGAPVSAARPKPEPAPSRAC